jgi:MSHA pilin protein MshA
MKNQKGFTLIELVVVIVILGILAVTAAPRFLNLQSDARSSALQGLKGAMAGASSIVYGKAAIEGKETSSAADETISDGTASGTIGIIYGYPTATSAGIGNAVDGLDSDDWSVVEDGSGFYATFKTDPEPTAKPSSCFVEYIAPTANGESPSITVDDENC